MSRFAVLLGAGVGYVLGARGGRERYEQIRQQVQRVWKDPRVQERKEQAQAVAKEKSAGLKNKATQKSEELTEDSSPGTGPGTDSSSTHKSASSSKTSNSISGRTSDGHA